MFPFQTPARMRSLGQEQGPALSTKLPCRVPWRLAAYLKDVGRATAAAEGMLDVMKAQQKFFESVLQNGNKSSSSNDWWFHKARSQTSQAVNSMHVAMAAGYLTSCRTCKALSLSTGKRLWCNSVKPEYAILCPGRQSSGERMHQSGVELGNDGCTGCRLWLATSWTAPQPATLMRAPAGVAQRLPCSRCGGNACGCTMSNNHSIL